MEEQMDISEPTGSLDDSQADVRTLDSVDDIADAFMRSEEPEEAPAEEGEVPAEQPAEEAQEQPADAPEAQDVPMPDGFDAEAWKGLTPEVRTLFSQRETAHAAALAQERQQAVQVRAERDTQVNAAGELLQKANALLERITQAEFSGIDWHQLSQSDPATYVQLSQQYNERQQAIRQLGQQVQQASQAIAQRRAAERQAALGNEAQVLEPKLKALMGDGFTGQGFVKDAVAYLEGCGVPREAMGRITKGYELEIVAKAMLFDRQQAARASAQRKVAEAPKVTPPTGRQSTEGESRQRSALAALKKNPRSTDAIADAFLAMG